MAALVPNIAWCLFVAMHWYRILPGAFSLQRKNFSIAWLLIFNMGFALQTSVLKSYGSLKCLGTGNISTCHKARLVVRMSGMSGSFSVVRCRADKLRSFYSLKRKEISDELLGTFYIFSRNLDINFLQLKDFKLVLFGSF